jgi:hypothetical protein
VAAVAMPMPAADSPGPPHYFKSRPNKQLSFFYLLPRKREKGNVFFRSLWSIKTLALFLSHLAPCQFGKENTGKMGLNKKSLVMRGSAAVDGIGPCFGVHFFVCKSSVLAGRIIFRLKTFILDTIGTFFGSRCGVKYKKHRGVCLFLEMTLGGSKVNTGN